MKGGINIQFGLKLWSLNSNLIERASILLKDDVFQYIELTPIPNTDIKPFLSYDLPYIIHITTESHGLNIADSKKREFNLKIINDCIQWADKLNARYMVLHPGYGSIDESIQFLDLIEDNRILIENMPKMGLNDECMVGHSRYEIERLMELKFGFCLDFGHAIKAARSHETDYRSFIGSLLELRPQMFHICDGMLNEEKDKHMNIGAGEYDFNFIFRCVMQNSSKYITMETPRANLSSLEEDLLNINILQSFCKNISL